LLQQANAMRRAGHGIGNTGLRCKSVVGNSGASKINSDVASVLRTKEMTDFLAAQDAEPLITSSEELLVIPQADVVKWAKVAQGRLARGLARSLGVIGYSSRSSWSDDVLLETLLPLGKVDPGLRAPEMPLDLHSIAAEARLLEEIGYDGHVVEETKHDPFILLALAAQTTRTLKLGTSVAIAFPRSPTVTAMSAWTLQKLSNGRFTLGLGTQVKAHIERRFGMPWTPAGPWMREYVSAVRAVWDCWQNGTPLDVRGPHYNINLMVPLFDPGPIEHPDIPIHIAAVNPMMCQVAGEVAEGIRPHPVCTPSYIERVMLPAVRAGAVKAGRSLDRFQVCMKPLVATAANEAELVPKVRDARADRLLCLDAAISRRVRSSRSGRSRGPAEAVIARATLGGDAPAH
jgi:probable F420-dependent oxidoreductase